MSVIKVASAAKFLPYQRLRYDGGLNDFERGSVQLGRSRSWFKRVPIKRRFRLKVPSLMRRILRRKVKLISAVRHSYTKVLERFKEGQSHFGDLFAGNYLFIQVNPTSLKSLEKRHNLHGFSSSFPSYPFQKVGRHGDKSSVSSMLSS